MRLFRALVRWAGRLQYRFFNRMRHREAFVAAERSPEAIGFDGLEGSHYCLLISYKRTGEGVPTPIQFGLRDRKLYFRSETGVAKLARLGANPRVALGPSDWRGKPLGPLAAGTARVVSQAEEEAAYGALKRNYTLSQRLFEGMVDRLPVEMTYVEVVPEMRPSADA